MFTTPCFIRKNSEELRLYLKVLGYEPMYYNYNDEGSNICCDNSIEYHCTDSDNHRDYIDCGTNEELFKAIAALRDDNDYMQWFTNGTEWYLSIWQSRLNGFHKATVKELVERFN